MVARRAHNPKVVGSSPASATTRDPKTFCLRVLFFSEVQVSMKQLVISKIGAHQNFHKALIINILGFKRESNLKFLVTAERKEFS